MSLVPFGFGSRFTDPLSTSFDLWDPFTNFNWPMTSFFNTPSTALSFPTRSTVSNDIAQFATTRIDWRETPEAHVFKADLPGIRKEEVKVEVEEGNVLQISGERTKDVEETTDTWHRVERGSGRFLRRFRLPNNAMMDQVKATMENGVLTVTVPKILAKRPEVKAIEIAG